MTVVIIGVDPGLSAGLSVLWHGELWLAIQGPPKLILERLDATLNHARTMNVTTLRVVCERYIQRQGPGIHLTHQPTALIVTGQVEQVCQIYGVELVFLNPADTKHIAPNWLLRKLGLLNTSKSIGCPDANDVNDATRTAVLCLATHHASLFDKLLKDANV
jgi:hypothetical protein